MDNPTRTYIETQLLTISELAHLLGLTPFAAMKQAERKHWDYVMKGRQKLYVRGDFVPPASGQLRPPPLA